MINEAIFSRLTADAGVSALIASRVYPHRTRFEPTYPLVIYEVTGDEPVYTFGGAHGLREANMYFQCIASKYRDSKAIAAAIEASLSGFSGVLGSHFVHAILIDSVRDAKIQKTEDADSFYYAVNVVITVHYE